MADKEIPYATGSRAIAEENAKTVSAIKKVAKQIRIAAEGGHVFTEIYKEDYEAMGIDDKNYGLIEDALTDKGYRVVGISDIELFEILDGLCHRYVMAGFKISW